MLFGDAWQMGIIPACRKFASGLMAATSWRRDGWRRDWRCCGRSINRRRGILGQRVGSRRIGQAIGRMAGLTLGAEQTLFKDANLGFELSIAGFEVRLTFFGSLEHGMVITRLLPSLIELGTIRTARTTKFGKRSKEGRLWRCL